MDKKELIEFFSNAITYPGFFVVKNSVRQGGMTWRTHAYSKLIEIGKTLEQPRQPEKAKITREEIRIIVESILEGNFVSVSVNYLSETFKSKGIEVVEK